MLSPGLKPERDGNVVRVGEDFVLRAARPEGARLIVALLEAELGTLENVNGEIRGSVAPVKVDATHPLYGISGATNAITYSTDLLGGITLIGPGAGRIETGYAIIGDILSFSH